MPFFVERTEIPGNGNETRLPVTQLFFFEALSLSPPLFVFFLDPSSGSTFFFYLFSFRQFGAVA